MNSELPPEAQIDCLMKHGSIHSSVGGQFSYRVVGPCCRIYDREELPWPCCRLAWRGAEPSWKRKGNRFVPDIAAQRSPSYSVEIIQPGVKPANTVLTMFSSRFTSTLQEWWYSKRSSSRVLSNIAPSCSI